MIQNPCEVCKVASSCRLKLNCSRYLGYRRALEQEKEDARELSRCELARTCDPLPETVRTSWEQAAREHPWKKKEDKSVSDMTTTPPGIAQDSTDMTLLRIQSLLALRRPEDSLEIRDSFTNLATSILREALDMEWANEHLS